MRIVFLMKYAENRDLSRFIPSKKLNCVIDRVNGIPIVRRQLISGIVETNRPDNKNAQYQSLVKEGDLLLNKLQKYQAVVRLTGAEA
jgi:26S proteasome regulatory subunit N7